MTIVAIERALQVWGRALTREWKALAVAVAMIVAGALAAVFGGRPDLDLILAVAAVAGFAAVCAAAWVHYSRRTQAPALDAVLGALERDHDGWLLLDEQENVRLVSAGMRRLAPVLDGDQPSLQGLRNALVEAESFAAFDRLRAAGRSGVRDHEEVMVRGRSGAREWRHLVVMPVPKPRGWTLWRVEDVTARREVEVARRSEEETLVDFLDSMPVGFFSVTDDGRILYANAALRSWLGVQPKDLHSRVLRITDFVVPPSDEDGEAPPSAGLPGGETVLRSAEGNSFRAAILHSEQHDAAGKLLYTRSVVVPGLIGNGNVEGGPSAHAHSPRWLFTDAPVGIAVLDLQGSVVDCNRAFLRILGIHRDAVVGRPLEDQVRKEDRGDIGGQLSKIVMGTTPAVHLEVRMATAARREPIVSLYAGRMTDDHGDILGIIVHAIDTTEQKILEIQFAQSQRLQEVGQLAGGVAHDFNNLLTAMIGFCDLLLERHGPEDSSFSDIMQIKQNANRATNLVRQLLAFSRKQTLQPVDLDVTDALADLSNLLRRLIGETIELKFEHGRDLGLVRADPGQFDQVIVNLVVNARDAMPKGGMLTVRTSGAVLEQPLERGAEVMPPGSYVLIDIVDTGVGIPKENIGHIFEPFFSTKEVGEGTGLGLSTVYGIVKQSGGFIFVDSAAGKGTTFSIYLPRIDATAAETQGPGPARERRAAPVLRDLTGVGTVLIVEDEDAVRMFGARALRNKGYRVLEAENGEKALEVINGADRRIDLIVSDVVMPGMDGQTLVKLVRRDMPYIKVILTSGYAEKALAEEIATTPSVHFLPKPFTLRDLATKVKDVLGR